MQPFLHIVAKKNMLTVEQVIDNVEKEINTLYFDQPPRRLFEPIEYTLALGGKRIRPAMTLIACNVYDPDIEKAMKPALAMEVFHNFTLLHDDLMDQSDKRRKQPTVHKKWDTNTAILSGDAMVIAAYQLIEEAPPRHLKQILHLFSETALEICCGQQYDMDFEKRNDVTEAEYMEMIRLKTAVLIACCLKSGAIIGGAPEEDTIHMYQAGIYLGLAFQLQDDLLDVYGDSATFGKNIGGDILCDKKTFLLINALQLASESQKKNIACFQNPNHVFTPEDKIKVYTEIYNQLRIKEITQRKINELYQLSMEELCKLNVEQSSISELKKFCNLLMQREY